MTLAYIALGSNVGDRVAHLAAARARIAAIAGVEMLAETEPENTLAIGAEQADFLNQMLAIETSLDPSALLDRLHEVECAGGRVREPHQRWQPRTIDADIVAFGRSYIHSADLSVPHPQLPNREFWRRELHALGADVTAIESLLSQHA